MSETERAIHGLLNFLVIFMGAVLLILIVGSIVHGAPLHNTDSEQSVRVTPSHRIVVLGCDAEDSCKVNYHRDGTWTVREVIP